MRKGAIYKNTRIHVQIIKFKIEGERAVQEGDAHVQRTCWLGVGFIVACVESIGLCSVQSMEIKQLHSIRWMLKGKKKIQPRMYRQRGVNWRGFFSFVKHQAHPLLRCVLLVQPSPTGHSSCSSL